MSNLGFKEFTSHSKKHIKKEELKTNKEFNRFDKLIEFDKYSEKSLKNDVQNELRFSDEKEKKKVKNQKI